MRQSRLLDARTVAGARCLRAATSRSSLDHSGDQETYQEGKMKNRVEGVLVGRRCDIYSPKSNGRGFTVTTISVAVAARDGNGNPRSRAQFRFPSVTAEDPAASPIVLSGTDIHSSVFSVKVVLEYLTA